MRTTIELNRLCVDLELDVGKRVETIMTISRSSSLSRINSNQSEEDSVLNDGTFISSSSPSTNSILPSSNTSFDDEIDYLTEFVCPTDSEDEQFYFSNDNNDDYYLEHHLSQSKLNILNHLEKHDYHRIKRSHKKINAKRQIKTKHAKSIKINSHNQHLYINHRLLKRISLDPPSEHYIPSLTQPIRSYSPEELQSIVRQHRLSNKLHSTSIRKYQYNETNHYIESPIQLAVYQEYTLNQYNIPDEPTYDDTMINFLLDMQNRDLSPEDYEMLLRLDERIERKTVNINVIKRLPTLIANENDFDEQCTICMETYNLGQEIKLLPCSHRFHSNCIETYLKDFSIQCPLDNLPLT